MIKVWILMIMFNYDSRGSVNGPLIIDNIYSKEECVRIQKLITTDENNHNKYGKFSVDILSNCIEVIKKKN
jgi:hypothetical protein